MSSLKQLIFNALMKCATVYCDVPPPVFETAEAARDEFIRIVLIELFPEDPSVPATAVESPGRKKRGPMSEEAKVAMKAKRDATVAAKKGDSPVASPVVEEKPKAEEKPKKAKKVKAEAEAKVEPVVDEEKPKAEEKPKKAKKVKAEAEAKPETVVEKKAKKVKPAEDANLAKVDPTWRKHLKKAAGDKHTKEQEAELLTYLNGLTKEEFDGKKAEEHVKTFLGEPEVAVVAPVVPIEKVDADLEVVEFNGKDYFVNPETKRVYEGEGEYDEEVGWTNYKAVGQVGQFEFAEMKL